MNAPRAWEIGSPDGVGSFVTENEAIADCAKVSRMPVTPLIAAPPEGAPSWQDLAIFIRRWCSHRGCCGGDSLDGSTCGCGLTNLLSRLPTDAGEQP